MKVFRGMINKVYFAKKLRDSSANCIWHDFADRAVFTFMRGKKVNWFLEKKTKKLHQHL